jgi:hypothetical protein
MANQLMDLIKLLGVDPFEPQDGLAKNLAGHGNAARLGKPGKPLPQ